MFSPRGPSLRELATQALSSVEGGYDRLAPKFNHTPFRTHDAILGATAGALRRFGPFGPGLDVCCGTGAGRAVLPHLPVARGDLAAAGFAVTLVPLPELGQRQDGSPRYGLALARKPA